MNTGPELLSSLPLQVLLYFHKYFFPFWLVGVAVVASCQDGQIFGAAYRLVLYIVLCILEPVRLYLGYFGNLYETVSALMGSFLLGLMFEIPLTAVLLFDGEAVPLEWALNLVLFLFLIGETFLSYQASTHVRLEQTTRYHLFYTDHSSQDVLRETRV
eukprot:m.57783 g.57783  ORF g.57783 m.57783 type:complete len:158 (-) comp18926_c0_seq1:116-589(-)